MKPLLLLVFMVMGKVFAANPVHLLGVIPEQVRGVDWFDYRYPDHMTSLDPAKIARPNSSFIFAVKGSGFNFGQLIHLHKKKELPISDFSKRHVFGEESLGAFNNFSHKITGVGSCAGQSFVATEQGELFVVHFFNGIALGVNKIVWPSLPNITPNFLKKISHIAVDCGTPNQQRDSIHPWLRRSMAIYVADQSQDNINITNVTRLEIADVMHGFFEVTSVELFSLPTEHQLIDLKYDEGSLFTLTVAANNQSGAELRQWDIAAYHFPEFYEKNKAVQSKQSWFLTPGVNWRHLAVSSKFFNFFYEKDNQLYFIKSDRASLK